MPSILTTALPSGDEMPMLGAGTDRLDGKNGRMAVGTALDGGYAHVDTAEGDQNEVEIGEILTDYDREDYWLTSKVLPANLHYESVLETCEASLKRLGTDYFDLSLVH